MTRVVAQSEARAPQVWPLFLVAALLVSLLFSAITPPFQAPDEFDHVKRAYMLGQGQILLKSMEGSPSGGYLDSGLVAYMERFTPLKGVAARKISSDELLAAGDLQWTGKPQFQTAVGTAYYFPLMYRAAGSGPWYGKSAGPQCWQVLSVGAPAGIADVRHSLDARFPATPSLSSDPSAACASHEPVPVWNGGAGSHGDVGRSSKHMCFHASVGGSPGSIQLDHGRAFYRRAVAVRL